MRLLFVHNHPVWDPRAAGGQQVNHELALQAVRAGHETTVLHVGGPPTPPDTPVPYRTVRTADAGRLLVNAVLVARSVRSLCLRQSMDVVWASAPEGGLIPRFLPRGIGLLATEHHPDPPPIPRLEWGTHPVGSARAARRGQQALLEAALLRGAHRVTVPSAWSRNAVISRGYVRADQEVHVLPNGVGDSWFEAAPPDPEPPTDYLFVGRLEAQKGIDLLLRALSTEALSGKSVRIVGSGPQEDELRALAGSLGMLDRVRFAGRHNHDRIRGFMARTGALVLPSRAEAFGLVVLEAMAAGLPVVAAAVGGVPEFNTSEEAALLVPGEDVEALSSALGRVAGDARLRARLVENGARVAERHRWARVFQLATDHIEQARAAAGAAPGSRPLRR